ncbi:MAG: alpha/beta fold hydrolase [Phycisphaerae bacterium]|jgi:pimeloyl-ACP methyl ester carboxylesterase
MLKRSYPLWVIGLLALAATPPAGAQQDQTSTPPATTQPAGEHGDYLPVAGGRLYYEVAGSGPAIVLLHDGLLHSAAWDAQWRELTPQYRVVRYDRRGYGRSDAPTAPYSDLEDLEALLAALDIHRATLIGCSAGGELAVHFAAAHPDRVDALVLIGAVLDPLGCSAHFIQWLFASEGAAAEDKIARWAADPYLTAAGNDAARARITELLTAYPANLDRSRYQYLQPTPPEVVARWRQIRAPALLIVGSGDISDVHAHAGAMEAAILGAQRIVMPDTGHLAYLEQPAAFNRTLRDFLSLIARRLKPSRSAPNFESGFARADGTAVYYEAQGAGEPLVLIHGGGLDHRMWDEQFDTFAQHYRVIRYDARGHGLTKGPPGLYRDTADLAALLKHLGIPRAHVLGLSLGGRIAIDFALEYPEMTGCVIPVSPGLSGYDFVGEDLQESSARLAEAFRAGDFDLAREYMQRSWTDGPQRTPEQVDPQVRRAVREMLEWSMAPAKNLSRSYVKKPPAVERLATIHAPTLAIVGTLDMSDIYRIVERLVAEVPGAQRVDIAGAAHMVNMEKPAEFDQAVLAFLKQHAGELSAPTSSAEQSGTALKAVEDVVAELYRRVTIEPGQSPAWDDVRALFQPEAVIVLRTSRTNTSVFTLDGFIDDFDRFIERANARERGFSETIVQMQPLIFGDIAHVLVLYEAQLGGPDQHPQRGVDSVELIRQNGRWRIVSVTNEICTPTRPPPAELVE